MLYNLFEPYFDQILFADLFRSITFRAGGAVVTSLVLCFLIAPRIIRMLKAKQQEGQPIREDGPETHYKKAGTPTMGGLMILISMTASAIIGITYATPSHLSTHVAPPFFKDILINISWFFIPWGLIVLVGASNAVNLTDGLDGLAIVPVAIATACFGLIAYLVGRVDYSAYLYLHHVPGSAELAIICGALIGGAMGFLWYNAPPAAIFMGDTGSLALGGFLGAVSIITKHEIVLAIIGGLFVLEAVSVIVQVTSFKLTGKRVFAMAPIHHHFEKKGWSEPTIVIRFWIIAVILALVGLATLKLR